MKQVERREINQLYTQLQKLSKEVKSFNTRINNILNTLIKDLDIHLTMMNQKKEDFFISFGLKQIPELESQYFNYDNYYLSSEFDEIKKQLQNLNLVLQEKQFSLHIQTFLSDIQQQKQFNPNKPLNYEIPIKPKISDQGGTHEYVENLNIKLEYDEFSILKNLICELNHSGTKLLVVNGYQVKQYHLENLKQFDSFQLDSKDGQLISCKYFKNSDKFICQTEKLLIFYNEELEKKNSIVVDGRQIFGLTIDNYDQNVIFYQGSKIYQANFFDTYSYMNRFYDSTKDEFKFTGKISDISLNYLKQDQLHLQNQYLVCQMKYYLLIYESKQNYERNFRFLQKIELKNIWQEQVQLVQFLSYDQFLLIVKGQIRIYSLNDQTNKFFIKQTFKIENQFYFQHPYQYIESKRMLISQSKTEIYIYQITIDYELNLLQILGKNKQKLSGGVSGNGDCLFMVEGNSKFIDIMNWKQKK